MVSGWSGAWSFATVPSMVSLSLPANGATDEQPTAVTLSWSGVTGAVSYAVRVSTDSQFGSTVFGEKLTGTTTGTAIGGLVNGVTYYWTVGAKDVYGVVSGWSGAWSFATVPSMVSLSLPANGATDEQPTAVSLSWSGVTGAVSYAVRVSTDSQFGSTVFGEKLTGTTTGTAIRWPCQWRDLLLDGRRERCLWRGKRLVGRVELRDGSLDGEPLVAGERRDG